MFYNLCGVHIKIENQFCENLVCVQLGCQACQALVTLAPGLQGCAMEIILVANSKILGFW